MQKCEIVFNGDEIEIRGITFPIVKKSAKNDAQNLISNRNNFNILFSSLAIGSFQSYKENLNQSSDGTVTITEISGNILQGSPQVELSSSDMTLKEIKINLSVKEEGGKLTFSTKR